MARAKVQRFISDDGFGNLVRIFVRHGSLPAAEGRRSYLPRLLDVGSDEIIVVAELIDTMTHRWCEHPTGICGDPSASG